MSDYEIINANSWELKKMMIDKFQELSGRSLTEASPETKIFETVAYMLGLREEKYNDDMKQNYLRYARDERLDLKGEMYGTRGKRLKGMGANAIFRFTISGIQNTNVIIPRGSRIQYNDLFFETDAEYIITPGRLNVDGLATCNVIGTAANGIPAGQIKNMVDIFQYYESVENITPTQNGADLESDENYRNRIQQIPESFTTAGSYGAYKFWAKSASPEIEDVGIVSPSAGTVDIYVLTKNKTLSEGLKKTIEDVVNDENIRPLTDRVTIKNVNSVNYNIDLDYYIDKSNESLVNIIQNKINEAIEKYIEWQENKIGKDINPDELVKLLKLAGVKRIILRSPIFQKLQITDIANFGSKTLNYLGVEEE